MQVNILNISDYNICVRGIRTCWNSFNKSDNGGIKDIELIDRVGNKYKHKSVLEHIIIQLEIKDISRALLQQLVRHRHISISVKSTRYTLKELKGIKLKTLEDLEKYCVLSNNLDVDLAILKQMQRVINLINNNYSNDVIKYALPEAFKTQLIMTLNLRELQHIYYLRSSKSAMLEFRNLVNLIKNEITKQNKIIGDLIDG